MVRKRDRSNDMICTCSAYKFPHRATGGKCTGDSFLNFYYTHNKELCLGCNCNNGDSCDAADGSESINEAECFIEAKHYNPGGYLIMSMDQLIEDKLKNSEAFSSEYCDQ